MAAQVSLEECFGIRPATPVVKEVSVIQPKKVLPLPVTVTYNGQTKTIRQWAKEKGMSYSTLYSRIKAWPLEMAMETPVDGANHWLIRKSKEMR